MPITQQWDDDARTIYRLDMEATDWIWADFIDAVRSSYRMIEAEGRTIHVIVWFKSSKLPPGNVLANMRTAGGTQPKNLRHSVIVNESGDFLKEVIKSVDKLQRWEGPAILATLDEARQYLVKKVQEDAERQSDR